ARLEARLDLAGDREAHGYGAPRAPTSRRRGSRMVKVDPAPRRLSTRTAPPCRDTVFDTIDSPRPVPFTLLVKSGSKILSMFSSGIPDPLSDTETTISSSVAWALTR